MPVIVNLLHVTSLDKGSSHVMKGSKNSQQSTFAKPFKNSRMVLINQMDSVFCECHTIEIVNRCQIVIFYLTNLSGNICRYSCCFVHGINSIQFRYEFIPLQCPLNTSDIF